MKTLFDDAYSCKGTKTFECTIDNIKLACTKFNELLLNNAGRATLNDWYNCLGIEHSSIGDQLEFVMVDKKPIQAYMWCDWNDDSNDFVIHVGVGRSAPQYDENEDGLYLMYPYPLCKGG